MGLVLTCSKAVQGIILYFLCHPSSPALMCSYLTYDITHFCIHGLKLLYKLLVWTMYICIMFCSLLKIWAKTSVRMCCANAPFDDKLSWVFACLCVYYGRVFFWLNASTVPLPLGLDPIGGEWGLFTLLHISNQLS